MGNFKQKKFTSKTKEAEYTFQHPGVRTVSKIKDAAMNKHGVVLEERLAEEVLKHVIVSPKMKIDDFDDYKEYTEVINAAYAFISGQDDDEDGAGDDNQQSGSKEES
ncbi:hypothetical protein [Paenibacillus macquariensis]|uniref:Phage protein n=1 Tax=Paenibacillus macquariensis TaxID=948756 RepID=A0ABY1JSF7_9BACL|nr:hypothetical protein [Paenibacillus macquariensis]MEC0092886.1 hypothetical protein [Paenibacillus macquariensis]OAB36259.1 hypothetical protein PMSM_07370 [Paenibacillus macquariensis subsp. macquariensis]SIQ68141.1 hypothetical protein SAMN05421578_103340 [Paenibacillus macquariensis]